MIRQQVRVRGLVQGVGFRPFVYRLAMEERVAGWVCNDPQGVTLEVEAPVERIRQLLERLTRELPPLARVDEVQALPLPPCGEQGFTIRASALEGPAQALILSDCATCSDCLSDLQTPGNRRYRYPFTNCTNCGPRHSILLALPYDRSRTTMREFAMCPACQAEYDDPADRRFHAQPNACPACGPQVRLLGPDGQVRCWRDQAVVEAGQALREGRIVAVKGLGGFHLLVAHDHAEAVARLRQLKRRPVKPLALMARNLEQARSLAAIDEDEAQVLASPAAPIVILRARQGSAPVGLMLAYTPLHHLLLAEVGAPVVATSGNRSGEPLCRTTAEARERLAGLADLWLTHDRPIARRLDDSLGLMCQGHLRLWRRARGFAPRPWTLPLPGPPLAALGGHQKATVSLSDGQRAWLGPHVGDLDNPLTFAEHAAAQADLHDLAGLPSPQGMVRDAHPDYASTRLAGPDAEAVWHHHAHLAATLVEHARSGPALGIIWDGTGLGPDGTIWGGEFLRGDLRQFTRQACLRPFRLPGGERAAWEPMRSAAGLLFAMGQPLRQAPPVWSTILASGHLSPWTSSVGRLFDAVAWLLGLCGPTLSFEGEAAMALEQAADPAERGTLPLAYRPGSPGWLDWEPALRGLLDEQAQGATVGQLAARFHNGLVEGAASVARALGDPTVVLSGGCFQNRRLLDSLSQRLQTEGFEVLLPGQVPPNDGGLSLGQVAVATARRSG